MFFTLTAAAMGQMIDPDIGSISLRNLQQRANSQIDKVWA